eukprot:gnl/MRDRNA2_/MRDRNA2_94380_c0_seq1.p1 gnl/MRDRNA2_/MRDRNA2_94380_c0~~gnl/MRDRNA2_/MRDRNA2_94380_c0_seq1.p1  ORF type:complete len:900 (-),score=253.48 gnl/MRDRNA2_/MRDRNA2_94380_c0_seq1:99-2798(-)
MPPKKNSKPKEEDVEMKAAEEAPEEAKAEPETPKEPEKPPEPEKPKESEKPPEPAKPSELEEDSPVDKRTKLGKEVSINTLDTTLDVMPALNGKVVQGLSDGGFQYLLSGCRTNVGVKSGRYVFEVTLLEKVQISDAQHKGKDPAQYFKVGFSTAKSSLFMGDSVDSVSFDSEGSFCYNKKKTKAFTARIGSQQVIAVLLNLNKNDPNGNTISLFKNGKRLTEPQAVPESLLGKVLYPAVTFKNVTLLLNFGPTLTKLLPFKITTLQEVAKEDAEVSTIIPPKDGKFEVHFPVGLPEEGTFDFVDGFLEKNPSFVELSDRAILDWASQSSLVRQKGKASNDKPGMGFGLPSMDDLSVRKMLHCLAPALQRNFVVLEVAANLTEKGRKDALQRFSAPHWKKVAQVAIGSPSEDFKQSVQKLILADKQKVLEAEHAKKLAEKEKQKEAERRKKAAEKAAKAAKERREAAIQKAKKMREKRERAAKKAAERKEMGLEGPFSESEDEPEAEVQPAEEPEEEDEAPAEPCAQAELTEDDLKVVFRKQTVSDLTAAAVSQIFRHVSLPDIADGFDDIKYCWDQKDAASKYIREWVLKQKREQRVEDIAIGDWFKEKWAAWQKEVTDLRRKQTEFKTKGKVSKPKKEGEDAEEKKEDSEGMEVDVEDMDVMSVNDIDDINSKGQPLYAKFEFEDWALLSIRFELYALAKSFSRDLDDNDIPGVTEQHLGFYYNKYFKKAFNIKGYNVNELEELVKLVKDSISLNATSKVIETSLADDTPFAQFVKLTEEHRRERERRVDAGDETAKLKFARSALSTGGGSGAPVRPSGAPPPGRPSVSAGRPTPAQGASRYSGGARASYYGSAAPATSAHPATPAYGKRPGGTVPSQPPSKFQRSTPPGAGANYRR